MMINDHDDVETETSMASVYGLCLEHGRYDEEVLLDQLTTDVEDLRRARDALLALGLLREANKGGRYLLPVSPEAAEAAVVEPRLWRLRSERGEIARIKDRIRAFYTTHQDFLAAHRAMPGGVLHVDDPEEVQAIVRAASRSCRERALTMQPGGGRAPATIAEVREGDVGLALRGVRVRALYQHSATPHVATRSYVRSLTEAGGEVRTAPQLFRRMLIFDGELAVVAHPRHDSSPPGAMVVTDTELVCFLESVYGHVWEGAVPFAPPASKHSSDGLTDIHGAVCVLLSQGHTDEAVGRKLGMSVRTVRRYVAEIVATLDSSSRFQAGAEAVRRGLIGEESTWTR